MEALEIESQTDQAPLTGSSLFTAQRELAKAQHLLNNPDHGFDGAFACAVDGFAQRCLELVGHLDLHTVVLRRRVWQGRETLLPTGMMGITARGDVWLNTALRTGSQCCGTKVASVQRCCLGGANRRWNGRKRGFGLLAIVWMIRKRTSHDEQTSLIYSNLRVVILLKAGSGRGFHDARLRVSKIVLVSGARPWHTRAWVAAT